MDAGIPFAEALRVTHMPADAHPSESDSFGERLRRERERHHIALRSIAENTKISLSLLQDLERNDASRWPSGIFRRAFIRAYAQAIGVDVEATAREFLERFPDPNDPDRVLAPAPTPTPTPAAPTPVPAVPAGAASTAGLRLRLADTGQSFTRGWILESALVRFTAIACDAAVIVAVAVTLYVVIGTLWMPLCLTLAGYYAGGILLLGNTPGVCLCALSLDPKPSFRQASDVDHPHLPVDTAA